MDKDFIKILSILFVFGIGLGVLINHVNTDQTQTNGVYKVHITLDPVGDRVSMDTGSIFVYQNDSGVLKVKATGDGYDFYSPVVFLGNETIYVQYVGDSFYSTSLEEYDLSTYSKTDNTIELGSIKIYRKSIVVGYDVPESLKKSDVLNLEVYISSDGRYGGENYTDYRLQPYTSYYGGAFVIIATKNPTTFNSANLVYTMIDSEYIFYIFRYNPFRSALHLEMPFNSEYPGDIRVYISDSLQMANDNIVLYHNFRYLGDITLL